MAATQMGWAFQFAPTGAFTLEANVIFETYAKALNYAKNDATAVAGKVITVTTGEELGVYMIEAVGVNGSLKKVGSDIDLSNYVTKDQLTSIYTYKGSKATYAELPAEGNSVGDVWNVESEVVLEGELDSKTYLAGTNWVWNGSAWDALAGAIDLSGYATISAVNQAVNAVDGKADANAAAIEEVKGQVAGLGNSKVDKVDGYSLVADEKIALIDKNAGDIQAINNKDLDNRVSALEGMFKDSGDGTIDLSQITASLSQHSGQISALESNKADKSTVTDLQGLVAGQGQRLTEAEAANAQQTTDISNLSTKVSGLETTHGNAITGLTTTVEGHTQNISDLTTNLNNVSGEVAAIKGDYLKAADIAGKLDTSVYEAKVAELEKADDDTLQAAKDYADDLKEAIDAAYAAADAKVLADAKEYADSKVYDDSALKARVKANEDAISVLNGSDTVDGSVAKAVKDEINAFAANVSNDDTINTFKELIDYAASHTSEYSELIGLVQSNSNALVTLKGSAETEGSVAKLVKDAVDAEAEIARAAEGKNAADIKAIADNYLKSADKEELTGLINAEASRAQGVESGLDGRLVAIENDYLKSADKTELVGLISAKVDKSDYEAKIAELVSADESVLAQAKKYTDDSLEWIDVTGEN